MKDISNDLKQTIDNYYQLLKNTDEAVLSVKPAPGKWSKKEELGHLTDSAQNNIQRFIRVQYEENVHIMYHPDNWVLMNDYQNTPKDELVELWYLLNKKIVAILKKMPEEKYEALMCFDKDPAIKNTTLFIAEDYVKHMTHHLQNIVSA